MKRILFSLAVMLICTSNMVAYSQPVLLPQPQSIEWGKGWFTMPEQLGWFTNVTDGDQRSALEDAVMQFVEENEYINKATETKNRKAHLSLMISGDKSRFASDEAYALKVTPKRIEITGRTGKALYYGLQTLRQLAYGEECLRQVTIADAPRYGERGVMLDVSRHFFGKEFVKKQIRQISALKMNRLHLHLTDAAGWRIEIKQYPRLTQMAAWRPQRLWRDWRKAGSKYCEMGSADAYGGYYTQEDIRELVEYAKAHYVTLVPEVEMPSHSEETLAAYPELSCSGKPYVNRDFCVGNEAVYTFWRNVLSEVSGLFPNTEIHIGGDEASKRDWKTCPKCQAVMHEHSLADVDALQTYFAERINDIAKDLGVKITGWDDLMAGGAPKGSSVQIWGDVSKAQKAVKEGHEVILSPSNYLYLDKYQDYPLSQPDAIGGYLPLSDVYAFGSVLDTLRFDRPEMVRGVEACLWAEYIPTEEQMEMMLYPRLFAVSEVGWSRHGDVRDFCHRAKVLNRRQKKAGYSPFSLDDEIGQRPEYRTRVKALSVGKPVKYNIPYSPAYVAAGDATLTDGLRGGWTYADRRWQGFIKEGRLDVTIDLLSPSEIHSVSLDFLQVAGAQVYTPATIEVMLSDDGESFKTVDSALWTDDKDCAFKIDNYTWRGLAKTRYVRVKANCSKQLSGWIFTDEIIVK